MAEFAQRAALVTGAASGIGRACALALAAQGAAVTVADIDEMGGAAVLSEIGAVGGRAQFVRCDVTSLPDIEAATALTVDEFGSIDILVNNAARALGGVVDEINEDTWHAVIDCNLTSVWRSMRCAVPRMRAQRRGVIVNMSSVQAQAGFPGWAAYAAAKGGIDALTQQTAVELAPYGIRVNAVAPGTIMTPLNERVFSQALDPEGLVRRWKALHPIGRFGEAHEVAQVVLFLASERASFVTGEIVRVDGGMLLKRD